MSVDGANPHQVTAPPDRSRSQATPLSQCPTLVNFDMDPSWSPDGSKIVFVRNSIFGYGIDTMNTDGTGLSHVVTNPQPRLSDPAWAPNGSGIAHSQRFIGGAGPFIVGPFGSTRELTGPFPHNPTVEGCKPEVQRPGRLTRAPSPSWV